MPIGDEKLFEEATAALQRIQEFDAGSLARENELGTSLNFKDAIQPAQALIDLFSRLSLNALEDFPDNHLTVIRDQADANFNLFQQILKFSPQQQNPHEIRKSLINQLVSAYPTAFQHLHPYISYSLHRSADFQRLDMEARSTLQRIEDHASKISDGLVEHEVEAQRILDEIRKVAAEEGVTQQAAHFRDEAKAHEDEAAIWRSRTNKFAALLGTFAVLSLFLHKIPFFDPANTYDAVQLGISKGLIFAVIAYMLFHSARNFLNHKHNAILNKHRQNALMTHKALIEATGDSGVREAIMLQAASCIFSPQSTGYASTSGAPDSGSPKSLVEILSKSVESAPKQTS